MKQLHVVGYGGVLFLGQQIQRPALPSEATMDDLLRSVYVYLRARVGQAQP